jgi:hypothetical protein
VFAKIASYLWTLSPNTGGPHPADAARCAMRSRDPSWPRRLNWHVAGRSQCGPPRVRVVSILAHEGPVERAAQQRMRGRTRVEHAEPERPQAGHGRVASQERAKDADYGGSWRSAVAS